MATSLFPRCVLFSGSIVRQHFVQCPRNSWSCFWRCVPIAFYRYKPLRVNITGVYIPDKDSEHTPEWQKEKKYDAKLFGRYGSASGVDPATLWPHPEQLREFEEEEREWYPSLQEMQHNIAVKEEEERKKLLEREKLIAENMAKMPQMVEDWRRQKREQKQKLREEKARRDQLLAMARERFGYNIDPRSPKFQDMVKEIEKEERKKRKLLKRLQKEESGAAAVGNVTTPQSVPSST
ncbi:growth arrest and DNA damage-inducible proteins-interacting protein 1 [Protopterus annectens]|uniref:growth arrest and DNA damage-inducible proteins-interacting protein 1 n=1 Tax=Protopterus annectens TaxID=7888 RepID=UPI001CFC39CF|nr:growth arrest and DNA damage-inducible proteins-interacting protein 1 [Protopterus annectens]